MGFTCDIRFPYNWAEEFYCGEKLVLSVELKCRRAALIRGLALNVSCRNADYSEPYDYSHYIDDPVSDSGSARKQTVGPSRYETDFSLLDENGVAIGLAPGTYVFNFECHLPDKIGDQEENDELMYTFAVKIRRVLKDECEKATLIPVHRLLKIRPTKNICFVWPGSFANISNYSVASGIVSWHYVTNIKQKNNRLRETSDTEESEEDGLQNWLDTILSDKCDPPKEDS
ncbi:uncharacterized protein LOC128739590 [Sabethes cyaneus]|uniref:uncharacterized protein LOC128739590 n=1 Tax=Sabethes cyaneus TaxID=53552 RepID=UPI00237E34C4|nr:uncharacterized protein LOC128739590 [Sabethes cyaneus]